MSEVPTRSTVAREILGGVSAVEGSGTAAPDMALARSSPAGAPDESLRVSLTDSPRAQAHRLSAITPNKNRMLEARGLTKEFDSGTHHLTVLRDVSFRVPQGALMAIVGPSGSGKTTLLGLLAGLDTPTRGQVLLDGAELTAMSEDQRARLRGAKVGFVFQSFQLIPTLTAIENVQVPLELRGDGGASRRARELLGRVGLGDRLDHFPSQLSGGEQQRVAIARAFVNAPRILFADEPTGNLDGATGAKIVALLEELNRESGSTVVLVTHDLVLAERTQRVIRLADGLVVEDKSKGADGRWEPHGAGATGASALDESASGAAATDAATIGVAAMGVAATDAAVSTPSRPHYQ